MPQAVYILARFEGGGECRAHRVVEHRGDEAALNVAQRVDHGFRRRELHLDASAAEHGLEDGPPGELGAGRRGLFAPRRLPEGMILVCHDIRRPTDQAPRRRRRAATRTEAPGRSEYYQRRVATEPERPG